MHLLLVNDDGIDSPLLHRLSEAAATRGHRVTVAAPKTQQSARSHAFTVFEPLVVEEARVPGAQAAWAVHGTPVDCTRIGLMELAGAPVDLVISGINNGYNAGLATYVSGTVGAAREAAFMQGCALAVSMHPETPEETVRYFADYAVRLAERLVNTAVPWQSVCNVNVPPVPVSQLKKAVICPISRGMYKDGYEGRVSPRGTRYYWLTPEQPDESPAPGTDLYCLREGHITVSFLVPDGGAAGQDGAFLPPREVE